MFTRIFYSSSEALEEDDRSLVDSFSVSASDWPASSELPKIDMFIIWLYSFTNFRK